MIWKYERSLFQNNKGHSFNFINSFCKKNKLFLCIKRSHFATKLKSKVHMDGKLRLSSTDKDIIVNACKTERIRLFIDLLLLLILVLHS